MEVNIETAVRVYPLPYNNNNINNNNNPNNICLQPNTINNTIELTNSLINYQFNYVYPINIKQNQIFQQSIIPLINYMIDGCDISIITLGQTNTGKTYTLYGNGINILANESEYGIIPRFIRQLFNKIKQYRNRQTTVHITWSQISGENIQDLLGGCGSIECNSVNDIFHLIEYGMTNITTKNAHTLFTLTLEQQWFIDNVVQHRISTASFCDLACNEKLLIYDNCGMLQTIPTDHGMQTLQKCIVNLSEQFLNGYNNKNINNNNNNNHIPYNQSVLTTLLRDSFGGRAKTLLICCISPLIQDLTETLYSLQLAIRCQTIKNYVTINSYQTNESINDNNCDLFTLQFTTNQLFKLVINAEDIFQKLLKNQQLTKFDSEQITKWLLLKQECDDCFLNDDDEDDNQQNRSLERIDEEIEDFTSITDSLIENSGDEDTVSEDDSEATDDDDDDEDDGDDGDLSEKIDNIYARFRSKTNQLFEEICRKDYPKDSSIKTSHNSMNNSEYHTRGARGRRGSIHCVEELSNLSQTTDDGLIKTTEDGELNRKNDLKKRQIFLNLDSYEKQIIELEQTIKIKENLIKQLIKNKDTKSDIKEKMEQKLEKLKNLYKNTEDRYLQTQDDRYRKELQIIEDKLHIIKTITSDNNCKLLELENSLHITKKQLEKIKKYKLKEEKRRSLHEKLHETGNAADEMQNDGKSEKSKNLSLVLYESRDTTLSEDELDCLRHEIRNLRKTREYLLEQRCKIDVKNKKLLNDLDERKLLKYEEAIEAIDLAIEYKNQFLCGNNDYATISSNNSQQQQQQENGDEKADKLLMENHLKLNNNEMRLLLQQFFNKIIDLRLNGKKLELQLINYEQENDNLLLRLHNLNQTLQRVRLDNEKRLITLQKQYEDKLQLVLRHFNNNNNNNDDNNGTDKVLSRVMGTRSKHCAVTLQMPGHSSNNNNNNNANTGGSNTKQHVDKNSLITRFTRYATRHETSTVPRQLQNVTPAVPQAKVTRQKNKIFIQQTNK